MSVEKARYHFHGPEKYNCAQAILKAFEEAYAVSEDAIEAAKADGGGRVEGGRCGALHAARQVLGESPAADDVERRFAEAAGSVKCKEIRKLKTRLAALERRRAEVTKGLNG